MKVTITQEAASAIRRAAVFPFDDTAMVTKGGSDVEVEMSEDSHAKLREAALPGESLSDTIVRVVTLTLGTGRQ